MAKSWDSGNVSYIINDLGFNILLHSFEKILIFLKIIPKFG